jgi:hypothetical protein
MDEYSKERERATSFDNRAGLFISGLIALFTIYMQIIPFKRIAEGLSNPNNKNIIVMVIFTMFLILSAIVFIGAFVFFIKVIYSKKYKRVLFDDLIKEEFNRKREDEMEYALVDHYNDILVFNQEVTDKKAKDYNQGVLLSIIAFIVMAISAVGLIIIA